MMKGEENRRYRRVVVTRPDGEEAAFLEPEAASEGKGEAVSDDALKVARGAGDGDTDLNELAAALGTSKADAARRAARFTLDFLQAKGGIGK